MKLSKQQTEVLAFIRDHGGAVEPEGGGYWKAADGTRLPFFNATQTVYSLKNQLLLKRTAVRQEAWRDTYVLAD